MKDRGGVFELAILADRRGFAVALRSRAFDPQRGDGARGEQVAKLLANVHQGRKILHEASCKRIVDDRHRRCAARRRIDGAVHLDSRLLDDGDDLSNPGFHRNPSSPLICEACRPPARLCTRGPVVMARASSISSARGASTTPTSIASKWLRT